MADKSEVKAVVKYLSPGNKVWLEIETESEDKEVQVQIKKNRESLNELLLSSMQMQNLMVLSGSGTSLAEKDGGPSMGKLWELCTKETLTGKYSDETVFIFDTLGYDYTDESRTNIEEFLSLCEAYLQLNQKAGDPVQKFVLKSKGIILEACSFKKEEDFLSAHETFIHRLSRRRVRDSRLKVFTTNYDTCFEEAASNKGIVVIDGFSFVQPRRYDPRFFDYDIVKRCSLKEESQNYLEGVFQLFKLHGSVNWEKDSNGIVWEKPAAPEGVCMIFPAKGKYQQSYIQPHLEIMARYLFSLREPNTCMVVSGFGFNDDHLAEPIISAIQSNPHLKVIIVDNNAEENISGTDVIKNKYWEKIKQLSEHRFDVWFINASFKEFADIIPDLKSLTPAEKLANSILKLNRADS